MRVPFCSGKVVRLTGSVVERAENWPSVAGTQLSMRNTFGDGL